MPPLNFHFQEFLDEIQAITHIAKGFLDPYSETTGLPQLARDLETIRALPRGSSYVWQIPSNRPLRTQISMGGYEHDDQGEHNVLGEITSTWGIAPSDPQATSRRLAKTFEVVGNASVRIRIMKTLSNNTEQELAMWRLELGNDISPGCYFHTQVLGEPGRMVPPFPHSLSVPRLPAIAFTPMTAIEFVLGEIFQDTWIAHAQRETDAMNRWRPIQQKRLARMLEWKIDAARQCSGSPWVAIKLKKPRHDLFL